MSYAEGFSNTILEAMACGLAVVSCHAVGVVDCVRDGENGMLTDPGDVPALAASLTRVITDTSLRTRLATAALKECRRVYSWDAVGQQIVEIYRDLRNQPQAAFDTDLPITPCPFPQRTAFAVSDR